MTTPQITALPIEQVRPHPQNVRRELRGLDELAESIKADGLHQPIVVAPDGDDYVEVMGNTRHAACAQLGWDTVPAIIRSDLDTEAKVLSAMLAENCARNDLTVTEEGDAFQRLLDLDLSAATVAKRAGRSRKQVTDRVTIAAQPEAVRQAVDDRQITLANALALAELADDHELYARVERAIGTPQFDYEVKRAIALRTNIKAENDKRTELTNAGYVEATETELDALRAPVRGFRLTQLWQFSPDQPDQSLRFAIWSPQPEYQAPIVRWYQLSPVTPEPDDQPADSDAPTRATPGTSASERSTEDDALAQAREAAALERKTAADRRRAYLRKLWEHDFAREDSEWATAALQLLRAAVASTAYMEPLDELGLILDSEHEQMTVDDPRLDPADWSSLRLQFAAWWCRAGHISEAEVANYNPTFWEPEAAEYLETLRDVLGYELSDIEDALLDTYHAFNDGDGDD